jgi:2-hydroxymuconate-semialdehyde hydrolase
MAEVKHGTVGSGRLSTFFSRAGEGSPQAIIFLQGSGPGATGWSNWQYALPILGDRFDCIAPDFVGFGQSAHPEHPPRGAAEWLPTWVAQIRELIDHLGLKKVHLVGNSLGGAIALHLLVEHPDLINRVVLMGTAGVPARLTRELDQIWGFYDSPSASRMAQIITWFAYDESLIAGRIAEVAQMRYDAAMSADVRRTYMEMFPAPRQRHLDDLVVADASLRRIKRPVLLVHGRDDVIVPVETSHYLLQHLGGEVQMHIYGRCSHWTQVEFRESFHALISKFFEGEL